jgi:hypothetical protein
LARRPVPTSFGKHLGNAAGRLRARHCDRTRCPIRSADCIAAEPHESPEGPLASADPDLLDVCRSEQIETIPLSGANGIIWSPKSSPA